MADDTPPAPSESADDVTKNETIRITLPPKSEQPAVKRETVRINVPGKAAESGVPAVGVAPKKETTKLSSGSAPAPGGAKPFAPPPPGPPKPPSPAGLPAKPLSGMAPPPKPPSLGARPTVPLKPTPAAAPSAPAAPEAVTMKAASPKKETARITLPAEGTAKPALPKATVKMQQTQPLVNRPQSAIQAAPVMQSAPSASFPTAVASDSAINPLTIVALVLALASLATVYLAFSAAGAP